MAAVSSNRQSRKNARVCVKEQAAQGSRLSPRTPHENACVRVKEQTDSSGGDRLSRRTPHENACVCVTSRPRGASRLSALCSRCYAATSRGRGKGPFNIFIGPLIKYFLIAMSRGHISLAIPSSSLVIP